jgi:hypothetical protein
VGPGNTRELRHLLRVLRVPESAPGLNGPVFNQVNILQENGPALSGSEGVLVIGNRNPLVCRKGFLRHDGSKVELQSSYLIKLDYGRTTFLENRIQNSKWKDNLGQPEHHYTLSVASCDCFINPSA